MPDMVPQVLSNITWVCATAGFHDDLAFIQAAAAAATSSSGVLQGQVSVLVFRVYPIYIYIHCQATCILYIYISYIYLSLHARPCNFMQP